MSSHLKHITSVINYYLNIFKTFAKYTPVSNILQFLRIYFSCNLYYLYDSHVSLRYQ